MDYEEFDHHFDMKEYIAQRLKEMTNLDERVMAKSLLNGLFYSLYRETEDRYQQLEDRIYHEIDSQDEMYSIYTTITGREEIDPTDTFMFPMIKSDAQPAVFNWTEITALVKENRTVFMLRVFFEADFLDVQALIKTKRIFQGVLVTEQGEIPGHFRLVPSTVYQDMIFSLYKLYINNHREWVTINSPYLQKFFDLELVWLKEPLTDDNEVTGINVDFEDLTPRIRYEMVPMWNVTNFGINGSDFPVPCEDHVNFEHYIDISPEGLGNGFLLDTERLNISAFRRTGEYLVIVTGEKDFYNWEVCKIVVKPADQRFDRYTHQLYSNLRRDSLVKRNVQKHGKTIKTKAELVRQIEEFALGESLTFLDVEVAREPPAQAETSQYNNFIKDELRDENAKRYLIIYFAAHADLGYVGRDLMSFLVSQIQLSYPEFRCEGVLQ